MASADSEVRPEPKPLTIPPRQINAREAGPKAYPPLTAESGVARDPARIGIGECRFPILGTQARLRVSHDLQGAPLRW